MRTSDVGKKALVFGAGLSGLSAARLLGRKGYEVVIVDSRTWQGLSKDARNLQSSSVHIKTGRDRYDPARSNLVVVSPGVGWDHPDIAKARRLKIPVLPEFELGLNEASPKTVIAVTGTNGKSTTTALIAHVLKTAGKKTVMAGNIGIPVSDLALRGVRADYWVLELSSYQLEAAQAFSPRVGIWLNLTPDHLGRHRTMARYAAAKRRLIEKMTPRDAAVLNRFDPWCRRAAKSTRGKVIWFSKRSTDPALKKFFLPGLHNRENAAASLAALRFLNLSEASIMKGLSTFRGIAHRIETVRKLRGVEWVNDSKSTNVDSTRVAVQAFDRPIRLIMGGEHKGTPYTVLAKDLSRNVVRIYAIGAAARRIDRDLGKRFDVVIVTSLKNAVTQIARDAARGEIALLSPACASFDQFKNFEDRGNQFKKMVQSLK